MKALIHDVETETNPWYGQLASPYCPDNYVVEDAWETVTLGSPIEVSERTDRRYNSLEEWKGNWSVDFSGIDIYVAHNAAYEMSWLLEHDYANFMAFLKRGGRVYCTAYAHYLLSNMQDTYPALNDVAPIYGGTPKVDAVKALWEAGVKTSDIDPALLSEYLAGPNGDIANTTKVFLGTWSELVRRNMLKMALVRMDGLLFSAVCMHHGLKVDMDVAERDRQRNERLLEKLHSQVFEYLPKDMPPEAREQFTGTRFQLSAFIFGGPMKYKAQVPRTDAEGNLIYKKAEGPYFKSIKGALPESRCVYDEEAGGLWYCPELKEHQARYTAGKNKGLPKFDKYVTDEVDTKIGELTYEFPSLLPREVQAKLATAIEDEWTGSQTLADGSPVISTSGDVLDVLAAHDVGVAKVLKDIGKIDKDLGAFYIKRTFNKDGSLKKEGGMLQYVQPDGFIHHTLLHFSTVTARLSSQKPNLQQLPRAEEAQSEDEFKSTVKEMFVSRFGEDGGILQEDYSALETVGLQVLTGDVNLKEALLKGLDMHSMRLAAMENQTYEYVVARTKNEEHPEHGKWHVMRTDVKPVAFQYQYGATAYGMAMSTGKSQEFCQAFIDAERAAFPGVEEWYDNVVFPTVEATAAANKPQRVQLEDGRYVMFGWGTFTSHDGTTYQFRQVSKKRWNPVTKRREEVKEFSVPQMRNYPIQGSSGFFVQLACGMLIRHFIANDFYGGKCLPINTVHDACYFDCHKDVVRRAAMEVEAIMSSIPEVLNAFWPAYNCEVPFPVAGGFGKNMAEEHPVFKKDEKEQYIAERTEFKRAFLASKGIDLMFP
ncbi:DNA polymerase [Cronobacter phage Dev-CD-23823]|uniref:DNA polymerase I n=1 Tax=Cronobacter phage Dev-CD-23823 TaxID=1712539 RepID=A0A0K8IY12_9CAUD|nr:DNA polymerase [Cronobacter phage Dev-CD-23823]CUH74595.1 DNA polymerase I [Cronobacter phage Dev-CD-23823]